MTPQNDRARPAAFPLAPGQSGGPLDLPPLRVRTGAQDVCGFAHAIGAQTGEGQVPLTFPIRWLALPPVHDWIMRSIGKAFLPVHEAQNFAFERELQLETEYILRIEAKRSSAPARLTLAMSISTPEGDRCALCEAVLRLVPIAADAA